MSALFSKPSVPDVRPIQDKEAIFQAKMKERQRLAGARGRGGTILGGSADDGRLEKKSLLGQ